MPTQKMYDAGREDAEYRRRGASYEVLKAAREEAERRLQHYPHTGQQDVDALRKAEMEAKAREDAEDSHAKRKRLREEAAVAASPPPKK